MITRHLANHYNTVYVPEYSREYVEKLQRKYRLDDVIHIAQKQIELEKELQGRANQILFYDTFLIITKIWLQVVFQIVPAWLED